MAVRAAFAFATIAFVVACESPSSPTGAPFQRSEARAPVPSPPAPFATPSLATLVVERAFVTVTPQENGSFFNIRFQLRETGGTSGATIQDVSVFEPGGSRNLTGPHCWRRTIRVPPGEILDTFYTDVGVRSLSYCAPEAWGTWERPDFGLTVTFTDDDGKFGKVEASVSSAND